MFFCGLGNNVLHGYQVLALQQFIFFI